MAIAFGTKAENHTEGVTSLTITKPASTAEGDLLIAHISHVSSDTTAHAAPAGWTNITTTAQGTVQRVSTWFKVAGGAEAADYAFTKGVGNADMIGAIMRFTGDFGADPIDVEAAATYADPGSGGDDPPSPTVTTTVDDTMIISMVADSGVSISYTAPSGMTERYDVGYGDASPGFYGIAGATVAQAAAGASGAKTWAASSNTTGVGVTIAIAEEGGAAHTLTPSDTITLSDAISKRPVKVFADTITLSESATTTEVEDPGTTGIGASGGTMHIVHRRRRRR